MNEVEPGVKYLLARSDEAYFNTIRSSQTYLSKLNRLKEHLPEAMTIVSLGMAGGDDLCTLAEIYGGATRLIGIDISPVALEMARKATSAAGVEADFIEGEATNLDIPNGSVDGFILFAVLHEVYSYAVEGKDAFTKAVEEAYRKTSRDGCIFVSDFAGPSIKGQAKLRPKTDEANRFIDYFLNNFRRFNGSEQPLYMNSRPYMDYLYWGGDVLLSDTALISEVLWHFKHYMKNVGDFSFNDDPCDWKEINEVYHPPNPFSFKDRPMSIDDYVATVLRICQNVDTSEEASPVCLSATSTPQSQGTIDMLDRHFFVTLDESTTSKRLIMELTNWMDLIIKKRR